MRLSKSLYHLYVNSKPIQQFKHPTTPQTVWSSLMNHLQVAKHLMSQGYKQTKQDCKFLKNNWQYDQTSVAPETKKKLDQIWANIVKVPPIAFLFCLPGGLPLILIYMKFLPALMPTWFLFDTQEQSRLQKRKILKEKAFKYFIQNQGITKSEESFQTNIDREVYQRMSLNEKRKVHQLCFGEAVDGTNILSSIFKVKFNYFISPAFSSYLLDKSMERKLEYQGQSTNDKLKQKILKQIETEKI